MNYRASLYYQMISDDTMKVVKAAKQYYVRHLWQVCFIYEKI
jgi:hypothetical protein